MLCNECWNLHQDKSFISLRKALGKVLPHMSGPPPLGCIHTIPVFFHCIFTYVSSSKSWCGELEAEVSYGIPHIPGLEHCLSACPCWLMLNKVSPQFELATVVQGSYTELVLLLDLKQISVPVLTFKKMVSKLNHPILSWPFPCQGSPILRRTWNLR